ncbi:MAG: hypothetical protein LBJ92_00960 [Holosporales bacterium]|jgi:hypothetical protein|nr:hypothetical protein [Holosporales bacterium]
MRKVVAGLLIAMIFANNPSNATAEMSHDVSVDGLQKELNDNSVTQIGTHMSQLVHYIIQSPNRLYDLDEYATRSGPGPRIIAKALKIVKALNKLDIPRYNYNQTDPEFIAVVGAQLGEIWNVPDGLQLSETIVGWINILHDSLHVFSTTDEDFVENIGKNFEGEDLLAASLKELNMNPLIFADDLLYLQLIQYYGY